MDYNDVIPWLLEGDVSVQFQTHRDLILSPSDTCKKLQEKIAFEGWGKQFLEKRDPVTGLWANAYYSPKWISTHYTLLNLKNMGISPDCPEYIKSSEILLNHMWPDPGSIKKIKRARKPDLCVCAMILSICSYAQIQSPKLNEIVDYILETHYPDGGWNCQWDRGDTHSSLHTTLTVLESLRDYELYGYCYRLAEIKNCIPAAWEFILQKRLFRSVRTGEVIHPSLLMLSYPCRWKYDILRCMEYFASVQKSYDDRMAEALEIIIRKKRMHNHWPVQQKYPGLVYFDMEQTGGDSRWNTLRALRVLKVYEQDLFADCK